jgi:hypothetical protein
MTPEEREVVKVALAGWDGQYLANVDMTALADAVAMLVMSRAEQTVPQPPVHLVSDGYGTTRCCYRTPFELPRADWITTDPDAVTCGITRPTGDRCGRAQVVFWGGSAWLHPMDMGVCDRPPKVPDGG